jgi:hypothetical protein
LADTEIITHQPDARPGMKKIFKKMIDGHTINDRYSIEMLPSDT